MTEGYMIRKDSDNGTEKTKSPEFLQNSPGGRDAIWGLSSTHVSTVFQRRSSPRLT